MFWTELGKYTMDDEGGLREVRENAVNEGILNLSKDLFLNYLLLIITIDIFFAALWYYSGGWNPS